MGRPAALFAEPGFLALPIVEFRQYDVAHDGKSFVMIQLPNAQAPEQAPVLVANWFAELERKLSEKR